MKRGAWPIRVLWLGLPVAAGPALGDALDGTSGAVQLTCSIGLWAIWTAVVGATVVPRTTTLTCVRIVAPAALVATIVAAGTGETSIADGIAGAYAMTTAVVALAPSTGAAFVNGSAYGDEVRFPLRPPAPLLAGPVELAWAVTVAGLVSGPLLLAAEVLVAGVAALAVGVVAARVTVRALHGLARRWLVIVPAGFVVHDPMTLADPVLLRRSMLRRVGPAPATPDDDSVDCTANALGLALEVVLAEPIEMPVVRGRMTEPRSANRVLFTPTRPGAFLRALRERGMAATP